VAHYRRGGRAQFHAPTIVRLAEMALPEHILVLLDGQGRARREAARRRNSECKIVEIPLAAMSVDLQRAAVIGWRRGAATNVPRRQPITAAL